MAKKKSFPLRINQEIYDMVQKWADDDFRSVNAQIEYLLREQLKQSGRLKPEKEK
ncbi:Arc family DNA-binding protein [Terribacillus saccharophilus]|uniref:Arc family DNA-binding protein n=1 Tax=Terribacillus saccharophilus TaxID=361277 RepID=UPI003982AF49